MGLIEHDSKPKRIVSHRHHGSLAVKLNIPGLTTQL